MTTLNAVAPAGATGALFAVSAAAAAKFDIYGVPRGVRLNNLTPNRASGQGALSLLLSEQDVDSSPPLYQEADRAAAG